MLRILGQIPEMPTRLPTTDSGGDPGLAALRLIEGYVLFCVAQHVARQKFFERFPWFRCQSRLILKILECNIHLNAPKST